METCEVRGDVFLELLLAVFHLLPRLLVHAVAIEPDASFALVLPAGVGDAFVQELF